MDPLIVLDCENTVPNRFALAVAAAGRARALIRGAEPRLSDKVTVPLELALREIAGNRWPGSARPTKKASRWRGQFLAAAPAFAQRAVH
ncbi:DNA-directed RNA polymerase subunit omega [Mesorhizobium sp. M1340]|uniref:DNA-directed RNA polymerase subunit omega n=1 Tax=Mesorhizobium sp. M1340 TaxID=2957087 RepID=UPI00333ADA6C